MTVIIFCCHFLKFKNTLLLFSYIFFFSKKTLSRLIILKQTYCMTKIKIKRDTKNVIKRIYTTGIDIWPTNVHIWRYINYNVFIYIFIYLCILYVVFLVKVYQQLMLKSFTIIWTRTNAVQNVQAIEALFSRYNHPHCTVGGLIRSSVSLFFELWSPLSYSSITRQFSYSIIIISEYPLINSYTYVSLVRED